MWLLSAKLKSQNGSVCALLAFHRSCRADHSPFCTGECLYSLKVKSGVGIRSRSKGSHILAANSYKALTALNYHNNSSDHFRKQKIR